MPDITLCHGTGCPLRGTCERCVDVTRSSDRWQSYFAMIPYNATLGACTYYVTVATVPTLAVPLVGKPDHG